MFTTGYGGYETFNLTDADAGKPTKWSVMSKGIEETVALAPSQPTPGRAPADRHRRLWWVCALEPGQALT